jgi:hypothetical protein
MAESSLSSYQPPESTQRLILKTGLVMVMLGVRGVCQRGPSSPLLQHEEG